MTIQFDNTYAALPEQFYAKQPPGPVSAPKMIKVNHGLAGVLGFDPVALEAEDGVAWLAGNAVPEGAAPLAQAYAGHQFGNFVPQLGDGRALLLGEVIGSDGLRRDIQLKGSGRTPFSRMGDGRAALGPVLREYIVSEAMHALGVPTTRALAAVETGDRVLREDGPLPGAVLTRVAQSHLRVGTFQYFYARQDVDALETLTRYALERHYPDDQGENPALALLDNVIARQARLVATWMQLGFIHGVMNTDNCSIAGETIDYGPCAFMDGFDPNKVFSSIDQQGRYAWGNQGRIAHWNMAQLAQALLPVIDADEDKAIEAAQAAVNRFPALFQLAYVEGYLAKLGLPAEVEGGEALVEATLTLLAQAGVDYTQFWRAISRDVGEAAQMFADKAAFEAWAETWQALGPDHAAMLGENPVIIPRNHQVQAAITAAERGDYSMFEALTRALETPFTFSDQTAPYIAAPAPEEEVERTFCGT
ncbi:MAG: YdiU family protein [Pseudomonadota bacterium]